MDTSFIRSVAGVLWKYPPLLLLALCWLGNCLSFLVLSRPAMRDNSVSVYLRFIALADVATTTVGLGPRVVQQWAVGAIAFEELSDFACKLHRFLLFGCGDLAVWCLTMLTVDRLVIVKLPLRAATWCTKSRAVKVCACIIVLGIAKNLSSLWSRGQRWELRQVVTLNGTGELESVMTAKCGQLVEFDFYENFVRTWLGFSTYFFGPLVVIIVSNVLIVLQLLNAGKRRRAMQEGHQRQDQQEQRQGRQKQSADDTNSSMTRMMLLVTLMYVVLITPSFSMYISAPYWPSYSPFPAIQELAFAATDVLVYSNHTLNFFMYVLSGKKFRDELVDTLLCRSDTSRRSRYSANSASIIAHGRGMSQRAAAVTRASFTVQAPSYPGSDRSVCEV